MNRIDPITLGLRWLHERDGHADEAVVRQQIDGACVPWTNALRTLKNFPEVVLLLDALYPEVMPYLIKGSNVSPVHHIAYVVQFMAMIAIGEGLAPHDVKRCMVAALLHDIGIGDSTRPKISEQAILDEPDPDKKADLIREGIASRNEHMEKGVVIGRALLWDYRRWHPSLLTADDVTVILDIVGTHDNSKIPLMESTINTKWLLRPGAEDWLKQCHWEADALWMLCPAGLVIDIQRRKAIDTPEERQKQFVFNRGLHRKIVEKYETVYTATGAITQYGFKGGLLYRTQTGYEQAMAFERAMALTT